MKMIITLDLLALILCMVCVVCDFAIAEMQPPVSFTIIVSAIVVCITVFVMHNLYVDIKLYFSHKNQSP